MNRQIVDYVKQHQKLVLVAIMAIIVIIVSLVITVKLTNKKSENEESNEVVLKEMLEELGSNFYEQFFYVQAGKDKETRKKFVEKYNETGIMTSLDNISKSLNGVKYSLNKKIN